MQANSTDKLKPSYEELEVRLGCEFKDAALLEQALTHSSYANLSSGADDYQRLEYLGDAVLDLVIGHLLYERFPEMLEGPLTQLRAALVNEYALARVAKELGLGELVKLGPGLEKSGGRDNSSILSDLCESVIGVIFLDGGYEAAEKVIRTLFTPLIEGVSDNPSSHEIHELLNAHERNYKSVLQEYFQRHWSSLPRYMVTRSYGPDHEKIFEVIVKNGEEILGRGEGHRKKDAEQAAARKAYELIMERPTPPEDIPIDRDDTED